MDHTVHLFPPAQGKVAKAQVTEVMRRFPGVFGSSEAAQRFLQLIWFPPTRAWRYQLNGKSGNTFMLSLLFDLEYGAPFSTTVSQDATGNQHPDFALFQMLNAELLGNVFKAGETLNRFMTFPGLSLATVRNPQTRLVSAWRYICRSHRLGDRRFLVERLRLNALAGIDWDRDADTVAGFDRFVGYLSDAVEAFGAEQLDPHWMPQALHIRPEIYRPDMVGRTEALDRFAVSVAQRLDRPVPQTFERLRRNRSDGAPPLDFYASAETRARVETIYADDFEMFEYPLKG